MTKESKRELKKESKGLTIGQTGKSSFKNKLVFKIPMKVILLITIVMVLICVILSVVLSKQITGYVESQINYIADKNASTAVEYLNNLQSRASALASEISRYKNLDTVTSQKMMTKALHSILEDDRIFSSYITLEPNAYYPNTPNGFAYYLYRDGANLKLDVSHPYATDSSAAYYAPTKETLTTHVTEPYQYKLSTGETVWLVTISCPILDENGKFLGVTNCDIKADTLNSLEYDLGGYTTSFSYILTNKGTYVTNTANKEVVGSTYSGEGNVTDSILAAAANGKDELLDGTNAVHGGDAYILHKHMNISNVDEVWSSGFVVSKSEVTKAVTQTVLIVALIAFLSLIFLSFFVFRMLKKSLNPISKIVDLASSMGNGVLNTDIAVNTNDELGDLAGIMKNTSQTLDGYVGEIADILNKISEGDLQVTVKQDYVGDFIPIKKALVHIVESLNETFKQINIAAQQVSAGSGEVSNGAQMLAQGATEQASAIEQLSASISTIADQVKQNASNALNANSQMSVVGSEMEKSNMQMDKMLTAMTDINDSSTQIAKIIKAIEDIAFQTNILALNAAVEAARAGVAGKGFAVVADEVRNLAGKSAQAATDTTELINSSVEAVEGGMKIAEETAKALITAVNEVKSAIGLIEQISDASNEQASSIEQITQGVEQISAVVQTNSATAEESAAASEELSSQAAMLHEEVSKFNIRK